MSTWARFKYSLARTSSSLSCLGGIRADDTRHRRRSAEQQRAVCQNNSACPSARPPGVGICICTPLLLLLALPPPPRLASAYAQRLLFYADLDDSVKLGRVVEADGIFLDTCVFSVSWHGWYVCVWRPCVRLCVWHCRYRLRAFWPRHLLCIHERHRTCALV